MFCDMCLFNRFTNWHGNYMIWNDSSYSSSYFRCVILNEFSSYSSYSSSYILVFCFYVKIIFFRSAHGKKHAQHQVWIVFVWNVAVIDFQRHFTLRWPAWDRRPRACVEGPCDSTRRCSEQKVSRRPGGGAGGIGGREKTIFFGRKSLRCGL